jgi:ATP/maltotriose-dependent transcriptional regulator MalT
VTAAGRGVAAGRDINAPVFTGDIYAPVHIEYTQLPEIPPPPRPDRPPEVKSFTGRQVELDDFAAKLAADHLVVIKGMAGVGKTALASVLARRAVPPERIFWHTAHESEGLDSLLWDLAAFLAWNGQPQVWNMLHRAGQGGGKAQPPEMTLNYLVQMLAGGDYLICLDDFHHLEDDPRLEAFVADLTPAINAGELSILITTRRSPSFLRTLSFEPLEGLDPADSEQLLAVRGVFLPSELISKLHDRTDGNPQLLLLAAEVIERADEPSEIIERLESMDNIENYLLDEVDQGLDRWERRVMEGLSVLMGYPAEQEVLDAVLDRGVSRRVLIRLSQRHLLLTRQSEGGRLYWQHDMLREFYYSMLPGREKRDMHLRAAEYYRASPHENLKAAMHYQIGGQPVEAVSMATKDVLGLVNRGGARQLVALFERLRAEQLPKELQLELQLAQGQALTFLGERGPARASYEKVIGLLRGDMEAVLPANCGEYGEVYARACLGLGELLIHQDPQEAVAWFECGLVGLDQNDPILEATLRVRKGTAHFETGDYEQAKSEISDALGLLPDEPAHARATAAMLMGEILHIQGEHAGGRRYSEQALAISHTLNDDFQAAAILTDLALGEYLQGNWKQGIAGFESALEQAAALGNQVLIVKLEINLGWAYNNAGAEEHSREHLENALEIARRSGEKMFEAYAMLHLADLYTRAGKLVQAAESNQAALRLGEALEAPSLLMEVYRLQGEIELEHGRVGEAHNLVQRALEMAEEMSEDVTIGMCYRTLGQVYAARGELAAARRAMGSSLERLEGLDEYEAARTQADLARVLSLSGDNQEAEKFRLLARKKFEALGARRDLQLLEVESV